MKNFISKKVKDIKPSGIRKFFDIANEIEGSISLGVGEPDFETPWHIREEGIYSLERGKTHYTSNSGLRELKEAISKYLARRYNLNYDAQSEILITVGGSEAIDIALRAMIDIGDEVIIPTPCYVSYEPCVVLAGGIVKNIPLKQENKFKLTPSELEKVITPRTKILLLNYPNNPTGAIMEREDLEQIAEIVVKYDLFVISDEIYSELTYLSSHVSIAEIGKMKERTIIINGFSKSYSMTGWRLGYACGPIAILKEMLKIHQYCIMCAPTISQYAAIEALENGDKDIIEMKEVYKERRNFVMKRLKDMKINFFVPLGTFYIFPNINEFGLSSEEFCIKLLNEEKVVLVPGNAFGDSGEGFVRISYAYSIDDLKIALKRIEQFVNRLRLK